MGLRVLQDVGKERELIWHTQKIIGADDLNHIRNINQFQVIYYILEDKPKFVQIYNLIFVGAKDQFGKKADIDSVKVRSFVDFEFVYALQLFYFATFLRSGRPLQGIPKHGLPESVLALQTMAVSLHRLRDELSFDVAIRLLQVKVFNKIAVAAAEKLDHDILLHELSHFF